MTGCVRARLRRRTDPIEAADAVSDPAPSARELLETSDEQRRLAGCLEQLEPRHSAAIRAAFLDGATYDELADTHECAARNHEELDSARLVETQGLSRIMSDADTMGPGDGGNLIAAEYVLGLLGTEERREVERRIPQEPALAAEVAAWEKRLGGLAGAIAPVAPPQDMWSRIEAAIAAPTAAAGRPLSLWQSLAFWRSFAIGSAALAAASIAALGYIGFVPAARAPLMATLGGTSGQPTFVAAVTASGNSLLVVPASLLTNDPRAIELWLIPAGEQRPRSLGLIQAGRPIRLDVPPDLARRLTPDAALAVSLEPPGGSPTGLPTGPVVALGKLTSL